MLIAWPWGFSSTEWQLSPPAAADKHRISGVLLKAPTSLCTQPCFPDPIPFNLEMDDDAGGEVGIAVIMLSFAFKTIIPLWCRYHSEILSTRNINPFAFIKQCHCYKCHSECSRLHYLHLSLHSTLTADYLWNPKSNFPTTQIEWYLVSLRLCHWCQRETRSLEQ